MSTEHFQHAVLSRMSPADQLAFAQTIAYLQEQARGSGVVPEGSIAAVLNKQSPAVRDAIRIVSDTMEYPRPAPFMDKFDEHQNATAMGFDDPEAAVHIKSVLDGQEVCSRLIDRMGTDQPDNSPLSLRESLSAAADFHEGTQDV